MRVYRDNCDKTKLPHCHSLRQKPWSRSYIGPLHQSVGSRERESERDKSTGGQNIEMKRISSNYTPSPTITTTSKKKSHSANYNYDSRSGHTAGPKWEVQPPSMGTHETIKHKDEEHLMSVMMVHECK